MDLYDWQKRVIDAAPGQPKRALFAAPRLGKTLASSIIADGWGVRTLVTAPLSVCKAWCDALELQGLETYPLYLRSGADASRALYTPSTWKTAVINYDKLPPMIPALQSWKPKGLIFDESHLLKNPQSARSKAARKLGARADYVRILTGTPSPNHYGDLWAQMALVNPERWGRTFGPFAQRYLIRHPVFPSKIIGHSNVPELQAMLQADADIIRREDVFGPDTYQFIEREVEMPREAQQAYDTLVREWLFHTERGEVLADHALKRLIRLQQLTSGYLRTEGGEDIDMHTAKIDAVLNDLEEIIESGEKALIFHRFTWEGEKYYNAIAERYGNILSVHNVQSGLRRIYGDSSPGDRDIAVSTIHNAIGPAICIAQTRTAALGVSFANATHAFFVSQTFSFTDEDQARDRIYKPGFNRCITYYRCRGSVDQFIARALAAKDDIHDAVTHADVREMAYGAIRRK